MIHYKKNDNKSLFESFKNPDFTNLSNIQNYIPIYNKFFNLNETNFNNINLNHKFNILEIIKKENYQSFKCKVKHGEHTQHENLFFKFSPLLDPVKYLTGAKNPKQKEKEILETRKKYKLGKKINIKKVSAFRVKQNKSS